MVPALSLWLPILVSAALVFVASSVIHMMLSYHNKDFRAVPDEDGVMDALRGFDIPAGDYSLPHAANLEVMRSEEYQDKARRGPVTFMTVLPDGRLFSMRDQLIQWFVYSAIVSLFAAHVTGLALGPGADSMAVFHFVSATAFAGYAFAHAQRSIWFSQNWGTTARNMFDGLVYGLLTGGVFGWLWP